MIDNPSAMPLPNEIESIEEPFVRVTILTPTEYVGTLMELSQQRRGEMEKMEYLSTDRVELIYMLPLAEIVLDFFDQMKSRTRWAMRVSTTNRPATERRTWPRSTCCSTRRRSTRPAIIVRDRRTTTAARSPRAAQLIPRQLFDVPIQAAVSAVSSPAKP